MSPLRTLLICVVIMVIGLAWQGFLLHEYQVHPEWKRPAESAQQPTTAPAPAPGNATRPATTQPSIASTATTQPAGWSVAATHGAPTVVLGSDRPNDDRYHMAVTLDATGAVTSVALNEYKQTVDSNQRFTFENPYEVDTAHTLPLQTMAIMIDGSRIDLSSVPWTLASQTGHSADYSLDIDRNGKPALRIDKSFDLSPASADPNTSQGYEVALKYSLQNLSADKHSIAFEFNGPTVPHSETSQQGAEIVAGYDDDGYIRLDHLPVMSFSGKYQTKDYAKSGDNTAMVWVGASGNYFNALVRPAKEKTLSSAVATVLNPDASYDQRCVALRLTTAGIDINPGATADQPFAVFFGPKLRKLLDSHYYSTFPTQYDGTLVMLSTGGLGWVCSMCTFPWLIGFLVMLLAAFHFVLRDWGLAIIGLVCMVRIVLHPVTKKSQVSMLKMQKLGPESERLKKKFGDDKDGLAKAQMELYKTGGFTPILGCLPLFFQTPIFIALWRALQTTFELRQAPFLRFFGHNFTWIHDLSQPDQLIKFASPIPLVFGWKLSAINLLPLLMAVVSFINQKYFTPKPAATTPEQEQQQKMMSWMTLVFPFMFYTFPSGLNLYYLTSTTLGIAESKIIRKHIKAAEALEAIKGPVIVDAGKISRSSRKRVEPQKKGAITGWLGKLAERAEQMAKDAEKKRKRG